MVHCPDCGSFDWSSEMQHGQALCTCAKCGCQWWDDSEQQAEDARRDREEAEMEAEAAAAEADARAEDEAKEALLELEDRQRQEALEGELHAEGDFPDHDGGA